MSGGKEDDYGGGKKEMSKKKMESLSYDSSGKKESSHKIVKPPAAAETIGQVAANAGTFTILVEALKVAGLWDAVMDPTAQLTVFAPTDQAFSKLGQDTIQELLQEKNRQTLINILLYHVIGCKVTSRDLLSLHASPITVSPLLEDSTFDILVQDNGIFVQGYNNDAMNPPRVIKVDIPASNGVIHAVNQIILPYLDLSVGEPTNSPASPPARPTIGEIAEIYGEMTVLVSALQTTLLIDVVNDPTQSLTVFAPTDLAFTVLGDNQTVYLFENPEIFELIVLYHVVDGAITSDQLVTMDSVTTLNGQDVGVQARDDGVFLQGNANDATDLPQAFNVDLIASNGVVHVINRVLLPYLPITATAALNGSFTILVKALVATDLAGVLNDVSATPDATYTVFAPNDDAFNKLDADLLNRLLTEDTDTLATILLTHVVSGTLDSAAVADAIANGPVNLETLSEQEIQVSLDNGNIFVAALANIAPGAQVIATDVMATNGIIHVIDTVLLPELSSSSTDAPTEAPMMMPTPSLPTIAGIAQENGFSALVQALIATDLVTAVDEDSDADLTVFAPTNDAFAGLGDVALNYLAANPDLLSMILQYHIVAGITTSQDLASMTSPVEVTTLLGSPIEIIINGDGIFVQGSGNLDSTDLPQVTAVDLLASNGVVHVVDQVILPTLPIGATAAVNGYSLLLKALIGTDLINVLNGNTDESRTESYTVFAPTDAAFEASGVSDSTLDDLLAANPDTVTNILLTHVIVGAALDSTQVLDAIAQGTNTFTTASGAEITITLDEDNNDILVIGDGNVAAGLGRAKVVLPDVVASNGVIHVIDGAILLPRSAT
ncbi:hypothetical protein ACA910_011529 [Epithemia clementina (nom. ined.)]